MKYTLGSSAPSYIFHNQHKTLNNLYIAYTVNEKSEKYADAFQSPLVKFGILTVVMTSLGCQNILLPHLPATRQILFIIPARFQPKVEKSRVQQKLKSVIA